MTIKYSFLVLMASKILIAILFFLVSTDGESFSLHSLWSDKSRFWTLEECNFQLIIPMMACWFQYLLYQFHVLFIFLAVGRHQSLGTADISLSP